jgi:hypothetical protein
MERKVKSAGLRRNMSWNHNTVGETQEKTRPKTAEAICGDATHPQRTIFPKIGWPQDGSLRNDHHDSAAHILDCEDLEQEDLQKKLGNLALSYQYGTTTQRSHNEVNWENKLPNPVPIPVSTLEPKPDLISVRLNIKRLEESPAVWQSMGRVWDYLQRRDSVSEQKEKGVEFCSPNRSTHQVPGYSGQIKWREFQDNPHAPGPTNQVITTEKPRHTNTARRANIPGYAGHVHWTTLRPAHSKEVFPDPTSSARVHRKLPTYPQSSPFVRTSPLSKMVSLNSPYNPFNKVEP